MNSDQFAKYLSHLDHPRQLELGPDVSSLFFLYREHVTRLPYSNLDLYTGKAVCDLSPNGLLSKVRLHPSIAPLSSCKFQSSFTVL